jgi:hypothetical protein
MALTKSNPNVVTDGLAPKVAWITLAAIALAVLIAVVDKLLLDDDIPDAVWLTLLGFSPIALAAGGAAPPALQRAKNPGPDTGSPSRARL